MRKGMPNLLLAVGLVLMTPSVQAQSHGRTGVLETLPGRPWAQDVPLGDRQTAYALFLAGNATIKDGFFGNAAEKYKAALALWDHPAFHYNLGVAQMNLDQIVEAYQHFQAARRHGPRPIGDDKYAQALVYLNLLRNQLAEIEVVCDEHGAEVALDGKPLFRAPGRQRVMVRPGGHRAEASKPDRLADVRQVVVDPGDSKRVRLAPQLPAHLATTRRWPRWIPWVVAGAGAVAMGGAMFMDRHSTALFDQFDREFTERCPGNTNGCTGKEIPAPVRAQLDGANRWQWSARVAYAAGGLALATSAALLFLNRERIVYERGFEDTSTMSLTPVLMPHGAGVAAHLRF
jgi:hypothetical protein